MITTSSSTLSLQEAADRLGIHYMTAYRHVRSGKLSAERIDGRWSVTEAALEMFINPPATEVSKEQASAADFERVLVSGDDIEAWRLANDELIRSGSLLDVYTNLVIPAMQSIGHRWAIGELRVVDEHRATVVAQRVIARLSVEQRHRGRKRGTIVVGAVQSDTHGLPTTIVSDIARITRFEAVDLGANVPAESFCDALLQADRLRGVAICVSTSDVDEHVRETIRTIRSVDGEVPIVVGGAGMRSAEHAIALGADKTGQSIHDIADLFEAM